MKRWTLILICLGYLSSSLATQHDSFLVTGDAVTEMASYEHLLETPNFFTRVFPLNMNPNLVLVPRTNSGWFFGLLGLYQVPFDNQLDYAVLDPRPNSYLLGPNSSIHSLDPDRVLGGGAYLGYVFPYTGRDIKFEVTYLTENTSDSVVPPGGGVLWTPLPLYDLATQASSATTGYNPDLGQAIVTVGQRFFGGTRFRLHTAMGAKVAYINRDLTTTYRGLSSPPPFNLITGNAAVKEKSKFSGGGPAIQVDGAYFVTKDFALAAHLTNSILIGGIKSQNAFTHDILPNLDTIIDLKSASRAVPNIDGKVGLLYEHEFCGSFSKIQVELGYEFNHFFNAFDNYRSAGTAFEPMLTPRHIKGIHDFTVEGPYLSVGLAGISCPSNVVIDPAFVTVPRFNGGFILGIGAGYWQVGHNQQDYAIRDPQPETQVFVPSMRSTLSRVQSDYSFAGLFRLGYMLRNTPYDIMFNYDQTQSSTISKTTVPTPSLDLPPPNGTIWPILSIPTFAVQGIRIFANHAQANLKFNYTTANLEVGQSINAGSLVWLRAFEGLQYAHINSDLHVTYNNLLNFTGIVFPEENVVQESHFNGLGPRVGLDMALPVRNFALVSQLAGGFLYGSLNSTLRDAVSRGTLGVVTVPPVTLGTGINSGRQFSPLLDLKVGLSYGFNFLGSTRWTLDIGYMATHYFNAVTTFRHATNNAAIFVKQVDDITINGPYLNLSATGFSSCPPDCGSREFLSVVVPELKGGLEFAAELLYLQTHVHNTDYGIVDPTPFRFTLNDTLNPSQASRVQTVMPSFATGYRLHMGYIFPLTANDVSVNYTSFQESDNNFISAPAEGVVFTITNGNFANDVIPANFPVFANRATAQADFKWKTANAEFGRRIKFHQLMTRFFAGLTYAKVDEDIHITYTDGQSLAGNSVPFDILNQENDFNGVGPRFGVSADLGFGCGFSFTGLIGTDLLVGRIDSGLAERNSSEEVDVLNPDRRTRLVPEVDAKLGISAAVPLYCSQASLELGYQINHYFNVKDSLRFTDYFSSFVKMDQDIGFHGPYVRLQINL